MSKFEPLWKWIKENGTDNFSLTFTEIEAIAGLPIDHSFLIYKKRVAGLWLSGQKDLHEGTKGVVRKS